MGSFDSYQSIGAPPMVLPMDALRANDDTQRFRLGQKVHDIEGNTYRYVYAGVEALAYGELVTHVTLAAWDSGIAADGAITADTTNILHIDTITTAMTKNQYAGWYVCQAPAAGKGRMFKIKSHEAMAASGEGDLVLHDVMNEAFVDDVALLIFNPWNVELTDAGTEVIRGVIPSGISSGYYGFMQTGGVCQGVICDGSNGAAVVAHEPIVPYATDPGQGQGMAGSAEADIMEAAASPLIALEASSADAGYVPAYFIKEV